MRAVLLWAAVLSFGASAQQLTTICLPLSIPPLKAALPLFRKARVCQPIPLPGPDTAQYPIHVLAHGDGGGGLFTQAYDSLAQQIASFGFVVVAYESCWFDSSCDNGETSWLEVIKTLQYLEANPKDLPQVDWSFQTSVSGHSTGARVALMLAALRDTESYLSTTKFGSLVTPAVRATIRKIGAVIADHPDPMLDQKQNPDVQNWNVTDTPVMVITGSRDLIEPAHAAWQDFVRMCTPDKLYLNIVNGTHMAARSPIVGHPEGEWMALFL